MQMPLARALPQEEGMPRLRAGASTSMNQLAVWLSLDSGGRDLPMVALSRRPGRELDSVLLPCATKAERFERLCSTTTFLSMGAML
jgi:hypothetical protein